MKFIALMIVLRYRVLIDFSETAAARQTTHIGKVLFHKYLTNMGYNQSPPARVAAKTMVVTKTIIVTTDWGVPLQPFPFYLLLLTLKKFYFFSWSLRRSRISVRSFSSAVGSGAGAGAASSSFSFFKNFITTRRATKILRAIIRKSTTFWMKSP